MGEGGHQTCIARLRRHPILGPTWATGVGISAHDSPGPSGGHSGLLDSKEIDLSASTRR